MSEFNPYAPPETPSGPSGGASAPSTVEGDLYRDGRWLVLRRGEALPPRCFRFNASAGADRVEQEFTQIDSGRPILLTVRVAVPLCPWHRRRRRQNISLAGVSIVLSVGLLIGSFLLSMIAPMALLGASFLVVSILTASTFLALNDQRRIVTARRITTHFVWLEKVCPAYLAELPEWCPEWERSV